MKTTTRPSCDCEDDVPIEDKQVSPRRRRTIKSAQVLLDRELRLPSTDRRKALARIHRAKQPVVEARRIIRQDKFRDLGLTGKEQLDLSDTQELRAKLLRRDGCIDGPQSNMLKRIERQITQGSITRAEFKAVAAALLHMPGNIHKRLVEAERKHALELEEFDIP